MQIQFPRKIQLGFRPWYGLTLRQLGYLVVAGILAGAIVLFGPVDGNGLLIRVLIGLAVISVGVALAFFRKHGLTVEQWLIAQIKFQLKPHKRVWTRGGGASPLDQVAEILVDAEPETSAPSASVEKEDGEEIIRPQLLRPSAPGIAASSAVIVFVDMAMLLSFLSLVVYLSRGGLAEVQSWLAIQVGR